MWISLLCSQLRIHFTGGRVLQQTIVPQALDGEPQLVLRFHNWISWSRLYEQRREIEHRFGRVWSLRVRRRYLDLVIENCADGQTYLEIGAGQRRLAQHVNKHFPESVYKSMDVDARQTHDYYSLEDIEETFDRIFMFEVIEHLPMADARSPRT